MVLGIVDHYFSQSGHFLKRFEPVSALAIPIYLAHRIDFSGWINGPTLRSLTLTSVLLSNEARYHSPEATPPLVQLIHECQKIIGLALLIKALVKGYQTGSWKEAKVHLLIQAPVIAKGLYPDQTFDFLTRIPSLNDEAFERIGGTEKVEGFFKKGVSFLVYDKNPSKIRKFIHFLNRRNEQGRHPYKIFSLSHLQLAAHGNAWLSKFLEMYRYLEGQGEVILIVDDVATAGWVNHDHYRDHLLNLLQFGNERPSNVHCIATSNSDLSNSFFKNRIDLNPRLQSKVIPAKVIPKYIPYGLKEITPEEGEDNTLREEEVQEVQKVLDILGSDQPIHNVILVGKEEEETLGLVQGLARQLRQRKPSPLAGHTIYRLPLLTLKEEGLEDAIDFLEKENSIVFIPDIEDAIVEGFRGSPKLRPNVTALAKNPKLKILISAKPETYERLKGANEVFEKFYQTYDVPRLSEAAQQTLFDKQLARYNDLGLSKDLREKLIKILGGPCPLREQLALLGRVASIMKQREGCDERAALALIEAQQLTQGTNRLLPENLVELPRNQEEVICLNREKEVLEILISLYSQNGKNNVCLVGEAGCGKTQLALHIATLIKQGIYSQFKGYRVFNFSISSIMSGATYIGEWEGRLREILDFCQRQGKAIVFIDELHLAVGAGKHRENRSMDIAQMMKEYITDPNLRIIGATTPVEFNDHITKDRAFMDRFTVINIPPLERGQQLEILRAHSKSYSVSGTPLDDKNLEALLNGHGSLRTAVGSVAMVHSHMNFHKTEDTTKAIQWIKKLFNG